MQARTTSTGTSRSPKTTASTSGSNASSSSGSRVVTRRPLPPWSEPGARISRLMSVVTGSSAWTPASRSRARHASFSAESRRGRTFRSVAGSSPVPSRSRRSQTCRARPFPIAGTASRWARAPRSPSAESHSRYPARARRCRPGQPLSGSATGLRSRAGSRPMPQTKLISSRRSALENCLTDRAFTWIWYPLPPEKTTWRSRSANPSSAVSRSSSFCVSSLTRASITGYGGNGGRSM